MESASTAEPKLKKSRASRPKVKSGCQTCKIRRVKCDETKPSCLRCVKFGHKCDGYALLKTSTKLPLVSGVTSRTLVPKTPNESPDSSSPDSPSLPFNPALSRPFSETLFQSEQEYHYFQQFCSQTAYQLSGSSSKDVWARLMLQGCETSPSIRQAIIEIGSLNITSPSIPAQVGTLRHQYAYRRYNSSICLMNREVAGVRHDLKSTLIACLLFHCFKSFEGYLESATTQIYSGLQHIRDWTASRKAAEASGETNILGSETLPLVEEDVARAVKSLEIQVMSYVDVCNADLHDHYRHFGQQAIDELPDEFKGLCEARTMLELVIRRSMHWLRSTMHLHNFAALPSEKSMFQSLVDMKEEDQPMGLFFDVDPSFDEQNATLMEYERWDAAFQPRLRQARSEGSGASFLRASTLRMLWLAGYMSIASNSCRLSRNGGRFNSDLEELVTIARILHEDSAKEPEASKEFYKVFDFDMQIIVPLMTVGWASRHRILRQHAIALLYKSKRIERVLDGIVLGRIMAWLATIEEEGMKFSEKDDEYVPERAAATDIRMSFDAERRTAFVSCLQPLRGSLTGELARREAVIPW